MCICIVCRLTMCVGGGGDNIIPHTNGPGIKINVTLCMACVYTPVLYRCVC